MRYCLLEWSWCRLELHEAEIEREEERLSRKEREEEEFCVFLIFLFWEKNQISEMQEGMAERDLLAFCLDLERNLRNHISHRSPCSM